MLHRADGAGKYCSQAGEGRKCDIRRQPGTPPVLNQIFREHPMRRQLLCFVLSIVALACSRGDSRISGPVSEVDGGTYAAVSADNQGLPLVLSPDATLLADTIQFVYRSGHATHTTRTSGGGYGPQTSYMTGAWSQSGSKVLIVWQDAVSAVDTIDIVAGTLHRRLTRTTCAQCPPSTVDVVYARAFQPPG